MKKIIALILIVTLSIQLIPANIVFAKKNTATIQKEQQAIVNEDPYIVSEIVEKRDEYTKYFLMSDKSIQAVIYDEAVHTLVDGKYVDIDNNLNEAVDEENDSIYQNKISEIKTKFSKTSKNKLIQIKKDDNKISWSLINSNNVPATLDKNNSKEQNNDKRILSNISSSITYKDILKNIDLNYVNIGNELKENVIIKNKNIDNSIKFEYNLNGLQYKQTEDGSIIIFQNSEDNIAFVLDKPFMYDKQNKLSDDIKTEIVPTKKGFKLIVTPSREYLEAEDTVYPVVIDPPVETEKNTSNILDTFVRSSAPTSSVISEHGSFLVGNSLYEGISRSYIKFKNLPKLDPNQTIVKAYFSVWQYYYSASPDINNFNIVAHDVESNWDANMTWNTQPRVNSTAVDYFNVSQVETPTTINYTQKCVDITKIVSKWYSDPNQNYGVMLQSENESQASVARFFSSNYPFNTPGNKQGSSDLFPAGIIYYKDTQGLEDYWSYSTQSAGRGGVGYVNNYSGALTYIQPDVEVNTNVLPYSVSHVFNKNFSRENARYGNGWSLSVSQTLTATNIPDYPYAYSDADGTKHYFTKDGKDEDGLGYTLSSISGEGDLTKKITSKDGTIMKFDNSNGYLRRIIDTNGNTLMLHYSPSPTGGNNYLSAIESSSGTETKFNYNANMQLTSITSNEKTIQYAYDSSNQLTEIIYPDGVKTKYYYKTDGSLESVSNDYGNGIIDNSGIGYSYDSKGKIFKTVEYAKDKTVGKSLEFSYNYCETKVKDNKNNVLTYQFDTYGRPVTCYDDKGNIFTQSFNSNSNSNDVIFKNNKISTTSNVNTYINNLLVNGCFLDDLTGWRTSKDPSAGSPTIVTDNNFITNKSVKITNSENLLSVIAQTPSI